MENRIFLLSAVKGFMVNAIVQELTEEGFSVKIIPLDMKEINALKEETGIYLLYLDQTEGIDKELVFLKDLIEEKEPAFCAIGKPDDFDTLHRFIPEDRITAHYSRPVNVKELAASLKEVTLKEAERAAKKRILVVDDDGTMLWTIKNWLSGKFQVFMVNSGLAAIQFLVKNQVDLILLDYEMPVTTGPQVLTMLRSESGTSSIPVMFLTVKNDAESVKKVLSLHPEGYLLKTMPPAELIASIEKFFEKK